MKVGDLVVHIGACPNGYRARLVIAFSKSYSNLPSGRPSPRPTIVFINGQEDWKDQWRVFTGWENMLPYLEWNKNENRRLG